MPVEKKRVDFEALQKLSRTQAREIQAQTQLINLLVIDLNIAPTRCNILGNLFVKNRPMSMGRLRNYKRIETGFDRLYDIVIIMPKIIKTFYFV